MAEKKKVRFQKGAIVFLQGSTPDGLFVLEDGKLEVMRCPSEYENLDEGNMVSRSVSVMVIKDRTPLIGFSKRLREPYTATVRALNDSTLVKYAIGYQGIASLVSADSSLAANVMRQFRDAVNAFQPEINKYMKLYQHLCILEDNLALMYRSIGKGNAPSNIGSYSEKLYASLGGASGSIPQSFGAKFLVTNMSAALGKKYQVPGGSSQIQVDAQLHDFMGRLINLDSSVINAINKNDPEIISMVHEMLTDHFMSVFAVIAAISTRIESKCRLLFGAEGSWTSFLVDGKGLDIWQGSGKCAPDFIRNFIDLCGRLDGLHEELYGNKISSVLPSLKRLFEYRSAGRNEKRDSGEDSPPSTAAPAISRGGAMKRSMNQIFEFAFIDMEFQKRMLKLISDFKKMQNPFDTEQEGRKLRRTVTKMYWDLYKQVFIRSMNEKDPPKAVKYMISYGFFDEGLLEDAQIDDLEQIHRLRESTRSLPILSEQEFLLRIYNGKIEPSITEMGETYQAYLRELEKNAGKNKAVDEHLDENVRKVMYEIDHRLATTAAVCSGATATAFPILNKFAVRGGLRNIYSPKPVIEEFIKELVEVDFSVFYRETVLKLENDAREIILEEVYPYVVVIPIVGTKCLLWQDLSGTNKRSRGRIVVPAFFVGDLKRSLAHAFACFRWELNRSVRGALWADPVEGGLTGEYFDYVNTYKKNSKLSPETKEKIGERFKAFRTNRDRFADDYLSWIFAEREGVMRLNSVVREMFFKYIPFRKEVRDRLIQMPAFAHSANRYNNIHIREVQAFERRFKKYQDENGNYPEAIVRFMEFMSL